MAVLTSRGRKAMLKKSPGKFALSGGRFPINDKIHARNALARAAQGLKRGTLTPAEYKKVCAKANAMLRGKGK